MKKFLFVILTIFSLFSCKKTNLDNTNTLSYTLYNSENKPLKQDFYKLTNYHLKNYDSIVVYMNDKECFSYNQKVVNNKGIYNHSQSNIILTHSFDKKNIETKGLKYYKPFLNKSTTLIDSKKIKIKEVEFKLFHYSEIYNNNTSIDSYYLENIGFICYYNFDTDNYLLCNSISNKSLNIKELGSILVKDTSFFARYTVSKLFPNYHRKSNHNIGL
jgi:hypothetical protein